MSGLELKQLSACLGEELGDWLLSDPSTSEKQGEKERKVTHQKSPKNPALKYSM